MFRAYVSRMPLPALLRGRFTLPDLSALLVRYRKEEEPKCETEVDGEQPEETAAPSLGESLTVGQLALAPLRSRFGQLAAMSLFINILSLTVPIFVLQVYDRVVFHAGLETLKGLVIIVLVAILFDFVLRQARSRLIQMIALRIDISVTRAVFAKLTGLPLRRLEVQTDVQWRTLLRDSDSIRDTFAGPATILLVDLPFVPLFLLVIWIVAGPIAWILLALVPAYLALAIASSFLVGRSSIVEQDSALRRDALAGQLVGGRTAMKALDIGNHLRARFEDSQAEQILSAMKRGSWVDTFSNLTSSAALLTTVLTTTCGVLAIIAQEMTIGGLIAANMLAARVVQPLTQFVTTWRSAVRLRQSAGRIGDLLELDSDRDEGAVQRPRPTGVLSVENVSYSYAADQPAALKDVSFTMRPGGLHGIVGSNGSGKSTLLKVLQGLYPPDQGRVLLDGADIVQFGRAEMARWIGYVSQDTFLFAGSIRDNIAKMRTDIGDEAILLAAERAAVDEFVSTLPDGYGSDVGECGRNLSAGQRQRLAVARALVDNPPILLLDEPSSNLDFQAEQNLCVQLRALSKDRNVIVVTHSRPLLETCDNILVMQEGEIAQAGKGRDVLTQLFPKKTSSRKGRQS